LLLPLSLHTLRRRYVVYYAVSLLLIVIIITPDYADYYFRHIYAAITAAIMPLRHYISPY